MVEETRSRLGDAGLALVYENRWDRQTVPRKLSSFVKSAPSRAEQVVEALGGRLYRILQEYYRNRAIRETLGHETPKVTEHREMAVRQFRKLREDFTGENFLGLSKLTVSRIHGIDDPGALRDKIERYSKKYDELVERIFQAAGNGIRGEKLERLNEWARETLARLILFEMHPLWIETPMTNPDLQTGTAAYEALSEKMETLLDHLDAFTRELLWLRVRKAGRREVVKYVAEEEVVSKMESSEIAGYLLSEEFYREAGKKDGRYHTISVAGVGVSPRGNWEEFRRQKQEMKALNQER